MDVNSRFQDLLNKYLAGTCSNEEHDEFFYALLSHKYDDIVKKRICDDYYTIDESSNINIPPQVSQEIIRNILTADETVKHMVPVKNNYKKIRTWLIAASFIGLIGLIVYFVKANKSNIVNPMNNTSEIARVDNEMVTQKGSKSKIKLIDGTKVFLNADSKLAYNKDFNVYTREITFTGEGFFDVSHNEKHPFIIHTEKADIKVLGTAFNVKNYPEDHYMETSLIRGRIEVTLRNQPDRKIILHPSEKLVISNDGIFEKKGGKKENNDLLLVTHITLSDSSIAETSWMKNKVIYVNKPLYEITNELERQFNIQVIYNTPSTKNYRFTINLEAYDLKEIMQILQLSGRINYTIDKDKVIIE